MVMRNYCNYRDMQAEIQNAREFVGNSVTAYRVGDLYVIKSYSTVIAMWGNGRQAMNVCKYSMTTSKLQNIIRRAWGKVEEFESERELLKSFDKF